MTVRNFATEEGHELGARLAKWCDAAEPEARLRMPELSPRCASCAFREGRHLANGSPATLLDAFKCVMEGVEFQCHDHNRPDHVCSGWAIFMLAKGEHDFRKAPWDFVGGDDRASTQSKPNAVQTAASPIPDQGT